MSCGKPHEVDCGNILDRVYTYLDGELDDAGCREIRQHLDECRPCLQEYGLEQAIKQLLYRCCGSDHASPELRSKVMARIDEVRSGLGSDRSEP